MAGFVIMNAPTLAFAAPDVKISGTVASGATPLQRQLVLYRTNTVAQVVSEAEASTLSSSSSGDYEFVVPGVVGDRFRVRMKGVPGENDIVYADVHGIPQ